MIEKAIALATYAVIGVMLFHAIVFAWPVVVFFAAWLLFAGRG